MLTTRFSSLAETRGTRLLVEQDTSPLSFAQAIDQWRTSREFRAFFIGVLKAVPYTAFRWETPPVTAATANQPFEFVVLDSPEILMTPDPGAFAEHFASANADEVVEFANLGGDAILLSPCPDGDSSDFGHLAAFLRNADEERQHLLWKSVADAMERRLGTEPVWLNTAGGGVPWLHVRLDDRPKYYGYSPYRRVGYGKSVNLF